MECICPKCRDEATESGYCFMCMDDEYCDKTLSGQMQHLRTAWKNLVETTLTELNRAWEKFTKLVRRQSKS